MSNDNSNVPLPPWRHGQRLRPVVNDLVGHANTLATLIGGPGIAITRTDGAVAIALDEPVGAMGVGRPFVAKITSSDDGPHAWVEQTMTDGVASNLAGGRSGTTSASPAYEVNGRSSVPANTLVRMLPSISVSGVTQYTFDLATGTPGSALGMAHLGQHAAAASTTTWDVDDQGENRGVNLTILTGQRYDASAATPILYAYQRTLSFDANGRLTAISTESRVIIDTPEACS